MARILISFLGTGAADDKKGEYKKTTYKFEETGNVYEDCSFVATAIYKEYKADKLFLLGTVKSMWDAVYYYFGGDDIADDVFDEIYNYRKCKTTNYKSPLKLPHQSDIEAALGGGSRVVLLKYGLNADDINYNSETILGLAQEIGDKDEIIVDITHSFRSLPMYAMNLLIYLRNVRGVRISHICYGMLEMNSELKYSPVVELNDLLTANDWITGAYSMLEFGNAYKIAKLLRSINPQIYEHISNNLNNFSDIKNLNHLNALEVQCDTLVHNGGIDKLPQIAQMVVRPVIYDFLNKVRPKPTDNQNHRHSLFQYRLACWHFEKHNYLASYISLNEAIISLACEKSKAPDPLDFDTREEVKAKLKRIRDDNESKNELYELAKLSGIVSYRRNALAHNMRQNRTTTSPKKIQEEIQEEIQEMINDLRTYLLVRMPLHYRHGRR